MAKYIINSSCVEFFCPVVGSTHVTEMSTCNKLFIVDFRVCFLFPRQYFFDIYSF